MLSLSMMRELAAGACAAVTDIHAASVSHSTMTPGKVC